MVGVQIAASAFNWPAKKEINELEYAKTDNVIN
jgi:hypothetical protein